MNESQFDQFAPERAETGVQPSLSAESIPGPHTDEQQAEYLAAYRLQLRRLSCPGCGEEEPVF